MKQLTTLVLALVLFTSASAQTSGAKQDAKQVLKTYLIERDVPGAGNLTAEELKALSQASCAVLKNMTDIEWLHSYVLGNKIFCVYRALNEDLVREHARRCNIPVTSIMPVATTISPATAKN